MPSAAEDTTWERIEENARLLGEDENPGRDCDILREFFSYILTRWGSALNARDEVTKRYIHLPQGICFGILGLHFTKLNSFY